jgi:hypothetical protein
MPPEPPEVEQPPTPEELEGLEPEQLVEVALEWPQMRLTPAMVYALNLLWRDYVKADDDDAKRRARLIVGRFRRAKHDELHPGCERVKITVPPLRRSDGPGVWYVRVNERQFVGEHEMWACEARTILELVHRFHQVEANRKSETQHGVDLDSGSMITERVQAIRRA